MSLRAVIMGVSGCGKSSVGASLSLTMRVPFIDADDLHPPGNVAKMRSGIPLTDEDRWPWLDRVAEALRDRAPVVVACSALKRAYRDRIRAGAGGPVAFVHLTGGFDLIAARIALRTGHYMPPALLRSQFAALEPPAPDEGALVVDTDQPLTAMVDMIASALKGDRT